MADKSTNVKTIFSVDGETSYTNALKSINESQKTLKSELSLVDQKLCQLGTTHEDAAKRTELLKQKSSILAQELDNQKQKVTEAKSALEQAKRLYGENSEEAQKYARDLNYAEKGVAQLENQLQKTNEELKKNESILQRASEGLHNFGEKAGNVGSSLTRSLTVPITAAAAGSLAAFAEIDDALDGIVTATGATGAELESMQASFEKVYTMMPVEASQVSDAVGELNTQFGFLGEELEDATELAVEFAEINGTDVVSSIQGAKGVMAAFGLEASDLGQVLDSVAKVAQDTGTSTDKVFEAITKNAGVLKTLNLSFEESAVLIGRIQQSGVDANKALGYLAKGAATMAKEGKTLTEGMIDLEEVLNSSASETEKMNAASELFGQKGGLFMIDAAKRGALGFADLAEAAEGAAGTVARTYAATLDPLDAWKVALNNLKVAGAELGTEVQIALAPIIEDFIELIKNLTSWFRNLDDGTKQLIIKAGGITAALGPTLSAIGKMSQGASVLTGWLGKLTKSFNNMKPGIEAAGGGLGGLWKTIGTGGKAGLIGAVAGLAIAIGTKLYKAATKVSPEVKELTNNLEKSQKAFERQVDGIEDNAIQAEALAKKVFALSEVEGKSAAQKELLAQMVGELNELMPGLNMQYDEQTDKINKTEEAVYAYIAALKQEAQATAIKEHLVDLYKQQSIAAVEAKQAEEEWQQTQEEGFGLWSSTFGKAAEVRNSANQAKETELKLLDEIALYEKELEEQYGYTADQSEEAADRQVEAKEAVKESSEEVLAAEQRAYEERYQAYKGFLDQITGAKISQNEVTIEEQLAQQEENAATLEAYYANRIALQQRMQGEEFDGFREWIMAMGVENTTALDGLVNSTDEQLQAYAEKYQQSMSAANTYASEGMETVVYTISTILKNGGVTIEGDAAAVEQAIISAMNSLPADVSPVTEQGIQAIADKIAETAGLPAEEAEKLKKQVVDALKNMPEEAGTIASDTTVALQESLARGGEDAADSFIDNTKGTIESRQGEIEGAGEDTGEKATGGLGRELETAGEEATKMSEAFIKQLNEEQSAVVKASASYGQKAMEALNNAIEQINPAASGQNLGQQFIDGILSKVPGAAAAAQQLAAAGNPANYAGGGGGGGYDSRGIAGAVAQETTRQKRARGMGR